MKHWIALALVLCIFSATAAAFAASIDSEEVKEMKGIMITAHSGCEGTPDNSMEHILKAIALGADCIEIDVNMDAQGGLWLTHNPLEDYADCVPLEDALRVIVQSKLAINCDLKAENLLYPTLEAAEKAGFERERLIFSGAVNVEVLRADPSIAKRARIFLNLEQIYPCLPYEKPQNRDEEGAYFDAHVEEIAAVVNEVGAECINPSFKVFKTERIELARKHGIQLSLWTVNEAVDQAILLQQDILNMTTRNVTGALDTRKALEK